jgi:translation initiation factor 1
MAKKPRIDLAPTGAGLANPFAALESLGLPSGPGVEIPAPGRAYEAAKPCKLGRVVLRREKAHRGGKTVIVIDDFATNLSYDYIQALAGRIKAACGCGGTAWERTIEIQGDQPGRIRQFLEAEGFRVAGIR